MRLSIELLAIRIGKFLEKIFGNKRFAPDETKWN